MVRIMWSDLLAFRAGILLLVIVASPTFPPEPAEPRGHDIGIIAGVGMDFGSID